jgi:hypothetical protein
MINIPPKNSVSYHYSFKVQKKDIDILNHVNNLVYLKWVNDVSEKHWGFAAGELKSGGADKFTLSLKTEIIQFIEKHYKTNADRGIKRHSQVGCVFFLYLKKTINKQQMEWYLKHRKKILIVIIGYVIFRFLYLTL